MRLVLIALVSFLLASAVRIGAAELDKKQDRMTVPLITCGPDHPCGTTMKAVMIPKLVDIEFTPQPDITTLELAHIFRFYLTLLKHPPADLMAAIDAEPYPVRRHLTVK